MALFARIRSPNGLLAMVMISTLPWDLRVLRIVREHPRPISQKSTSSTNKIEKNNHAAAGNLEFKFF
jgi:hypothetical protein